jgi:KDO2-lipid IV(A) lauroyltransferase
VDLQGFFNSKIGVGLAYGISRLIPAAGGERLAGSLGRYLSARKDLAMVKAVRTNHWVVSGGTLSSADLDTIVAETYANNALAIYRFYRNFRHPEALRRLVIYPQRLIDIIHAQHEEGRGLIVTGVHTGNFDLVLHSAVMQIKEREGIRALALSAPQISKGYEWQNDLREQSGIDIMPASMSALRIAAQRLEEKGLVVSGLDRPIPGGKYQPLFFGHPAAVPVLHVPLALRASVPVVVVGSNRQTDGRYQICVSDPIEMKSYPDRTQEILLNAQAVLEVAQNYIRVEPREWTMTYPVWPELLGSVP